MKSNLLSLAGLAFLAAFLAFSFREGQELSINFSSPVGFNKSIDVIKKRDLIRCSPNWDLLQEWLEEVNIPLISGSGNYKWKISTTNDSAQLYFNQGINMYYSFHIIEAMASFKKAARFDPGCGMLQWAQALAYGPNINDYGYAASSDALARVIKAGQLSGTCSGKEKLLIKAQMVRYSADSTQSREVLNQLYVDMMKVAYDKFPHDADVAALYADAMMLQHPWNLWKQGGIPQPWTPPIREVLEKLLARTPNHPGANHYYIHVMEPSPFAAKALPSADRLGKLTPGLSHTVHMPSHIYLRTGFYGKGVTVNENAVNSYKKSILQYAPATSGDFLYVIHNLHMQTNNAMLGGRATYSVKSAQSTVNSISKDYLSMEGALGNYFQYVFMTPVFVDIRFGRWDELLNRSKPDKTMIYANVLYHFGRGIALSHQSMLSEARNELGQMLLLMEDSSLAIPYSPFSAALDGAIVAKNILSGTIALREGKFSSALADFENAVKTEENMVYNEPRDWLLNPRHYFGNALLMAGKWKEAEQNFLKDMKNNNENGWALFGLYLSLKGQHKKTEASKVLVRFHKAFEAADVKINAPIFF